MTVEIALVFAIVAGALYLFATEKLPMDVTALLILVTIISIPLLLHSQWLVDRGVNLREAFPTVSEGLSGLSSTATVTVLAMFILSAGIQRAGLVHVLDGKLMPLMGRSELRQLLVIALLVGPVSGFINNTAAVAVAIPMMVNLARRSGTPASRLLLPLSFFGMMGGMMTLIGTSTNILTSAILKDDPTFAREIGMFEFTHLGLIVLATGLAYFLLVGRWLLPHADPKGLETEETEEFVVELHIPEGSGLEGQTLEDSGYAEAMEIEVLKHVRNGRSTVRRARETALSPGDILLVRGNRRQILDLIQSDRVEVVSDLEERRKIRGNLQLVRVLLRNRLLFDGSRANEVGFWNLYGGRLFGLETEKIQSKRLGTERLHVGEIVLVECSRDALRRLRRDPGVIVLEEIEEEFERTRIVTSAVIVAGVVAGAVLTPLPIVVTALIGVIAMVLTGIIEKKDVYRGVAWDVVFLLAGVIPLGIAMTKSGAAEWLAGLLAEHVSGWHAIFVLMALYAVTTLLTELVSNNASVVILVPVAISIARQLEMEPFSMVLAVMFAASTSFLSPVGYQTNTMIYGTGLYRFTDFAKVGAPLNFLLMVVTCISIWLFWGV